MQPSSQPNSQPSLQPSSDPTGQPSSQPTLEPSGQPSVSPTSFPSSIPTSPPAAHPSNSPTSQPSVQPSSLPTAQPSRQPSSQPSTQPLVHPSGQPSSQPTRQPSRQPSSQPSSQPTRQPSRQPTSQPTRSPRSSPTSQPTSQPSRQPIARPSAQPTSYPTERSKAPSATFSPTMFRSLSILPSYPSPSYDFRQVNWIFGTTKTGPVLRDISLSASTSQPRQGTSYLLLGSSTLPFEIDLSLSPHPRYQSISLTEGSGLSLDGISSRAIAFGGDFNRDRLSELLIGDPSQSSVTMLLSRRREGWRNVTNGIVLRSSAINTGFGWAVSLAGDFDGDGTEDVLVAAPYANKCYVIYGSVFNTSTVIVEDYLKQSVSNGLTITVQSDPSIVLFGVAGASLKDFNGDGRNDIAIVALGPIGSSKVFVLFGKGSREQQNNVIVVNQAATSTSFGMMVISAPIYSFALSISGVSDVNKDGKTDLLIGGTPYNNGYQRQVSYLIYGRSVSSSSSSSVTTTLNLESMTGSDDCRISGGGIAVVGVGDVNSDGFADMMITSYPSWQGQSGSYLLVYPKQLVSNPPTLFPTRSPTFLPTAQQLFPSSQPTATPTSTSGTEGMAPSSVPTVESLLISFSPSLGPNSTTSPSVTPTFRPTRPPTRPPTRSPTQTATPSVTPTAAPTATAVPTVPPTISPSASSKPSRTPTARPSILPTSQPSASPTLSQPSQGKTITLREGGAYRGENGQAVIVIASSSSLQVTGNRGSKHYTIQYSPQTMSHVAITITDFDNRKDILDFSAWSSQSSSLSYSSDPLTFHLLPENVSIVLSSHAAFDLNTTTNILFPQGYSGSSSTSSASSSSSRGSSGLRGLLTSSGFLSVMVVFVSFLVIGIVFANYGRMGSESSFKMAQKTREKTMLRARRSGRLSTPPPSVTAAASVAPHSVLNIQQPALQHQPESERDKLSNSSQRLSELFSMELDDLELNSDEYDPEVADNRYIQNGRVHLTAAEEYFLRYHSSPHASHLTRDDNKDKDSFDSSNQENPHLQAQEIIVIEDNNTDLEVEEDDEIEEEEEDWSFSAISSELI